MPKRRLSKSAYQRAAPVLRGQLLELQRQVQTAPFKVLLVIAGPEGSGRGELLHTLAEWLDPRGVETFSYHPPTDEELSRPPAWRFWRDLPAPGRIGLYVGSWYTETLREEARTGRARRHLADEAARIRRFEKLLADGGTLLVKVWLHLDQDDLARRLRALRADPTTAWRVSAEDWRHHEHYERLDRTARFMRAETSRPGARWEVIEARDERARDLAVGQLLLARFRDHQRRWPGREPKAPSAAPRALRPSGQHRLRQLPLDQMLSEKEYAGLKEKWMGRLNTAVRATLAAQRSIVLVFEGWDAAGKGGAIRRLTAAVDPRDYRVIPVAKPTPEEMHAHYLWRFWRDLPRHGRLTVFDRSWYGRVLVERIEGFCRAEDWRRAFTEINEFEAQLAEHGTIVLKFWLHVSHEEQLRRFREREATPHKRHKLNAEDWRNRRQRAAYEVAVGDMLALTDQPAAPWRLIPAEDKRFARIETLRAAARHLEAALGD